MQFIEYSFYIQYKIKITREKKEQTYKIKKKKKIYDSMKYAYKKPKLQFVQKITKYPKL